MRSEVLDNIIGEHASNQIIKPRKSNDGPNSQPAVTNPTQIKY